MKTAAAIPPEPAGLHEHLAVSLKTTWKRCRKKLKRCQRQFSEEAVHDFRVDTRRLLAAVELLNTFVHESRIRKARKALKKQLDTFDQLRDTQVQLLAVDALARRFPEARLFRGFLAAREIACARDARKRVKRIKTARLDRLVDHFREELDSRRRQRRGERDFATVIRAVSHAFSTVVGLQERVTPSDAAAIHRTRVAFKKFRYMVESLAPLLPGLTPAQLAAMHDHQAMMGTIQDAEVLQASYDGFMSLERRAVPAGSAFRAELVRRRQELIDAYLQRADRLHRFWPLPGEVKGDL